MNKPTPREEFEKATRYQVAKLDDVCRLAAFHGSPYNGGEIITAILAAYDTAVVAARRDELIRAAPHQVAHYFEIPQSELNAKWYLEYVRYRDNELKALEGKTDVHN
jgi:hypothetical protein